MYRKKISYIHCKRITEVKVCTRQSEKTSQDKDALTIAIKTNKTKWNKKSVKNKQLYKQILYLSTMQIFG